MLPRNIITAGVKNLRHTQFMGFAKKKYGWRISGQEQKSPNGLGYGTLERFNPHSSDKKATASIIYHIHELPHCNNSSRVLLGGGASHDLVSSIRR